MSLSQQSESRVRVSSGVRVGSPSRSRSPTRWSSVGRAAERSPSSPADLGWSRLKPDTTNGISSGSTERADQRAIRCRQHLGLRQEIAPSSRLGLPNRTPTSDSRRRLPTATPDSDPRRDSDSRIGLATQTDDCDSRLPTADRPTDRQSAIPISAPCPFPRDRAGPSGTNAHRQGTNCKLQLTRWCTPRHLAVRSIFPGLNRTIRQDEIAVSYV